jgi:hypothetical protein
VAVRFEVTGGPPLLISAPIEPVLTPPPPSAMDDAPGDPYLGLSAPSYGPVVLPRPRTAPLCETPCTLYLAPGAVPLHFSAPGRLDAVEHLVVPHEPQRVLVRSGSTAEAAAGFVLALLGGTMAIAGSVAMVAWASGARAPELLPVSATSVVLGAVCLGVGIPVLVLTRTGVERTGPLDEPGPRAARATRVRLQLAAVLPGGALLGTAVTF